VSDRWPGVEDRAPVYEYQPKTRGPSEVEQRVTPSGGWQSQSNLYQIRGTAEAAAARADSVKRVAEAREAGNRSGQYLANTVLFVTVLFFAGTAGKFEQPRVRRSAAVFAVAVFAFAVIRMLLLPAA
jgi:hypothetical protein